MLSQYFIIRIYRHNPQPGLVLAGTLEKAGASNRHSFANPDELIQVLLDDLGSENADEGNQRNDREIDGN